MPRIHIITGPRGVGKTTLCARVAGEVARRGHTVGGVLTERGAAPSLFSRDTDTRYVTDLSSNERVPFGNQTTGGPASAAGTAADGDADVTQGITDELTPGWSFAEAAFAFGASAVLAAQDCDLLVVDELGPLELRGRRGWVAALEALRAGAFREAVVVCRPELLDELEAALGAERRPKKVWDLTVENRRDGFSELTRELLLGLASSR